MFDLAFNNCNQKTNGEANFFDAIKNNIKIIFDVGCRTDTEFLSFEGEVHYFDPVSNFIETLSKMSNNNSKSYFNNFGLSTENKKIFYYPKYQSFHDRIISCKKSDDKNKILLDIKKAKDYIKEKNIDFIDFLKIDTEGHELDVLRGFGDSLSRVNIIQFEYGGTYLDNNAKINDIIEYLEKYNFHNFSYLVPNGYISIYEYKKINTHPHAIKLGLPNIVEIKNNIIPDHYNYCNIICFNKNYDLTL